jgi:DNA-binding IclR family transcriptional regulator
VSPPWRPERERVPTTQAAVLAALMRLDHPSVRDVADAIGRSVSPTHRALLHLRDAGWVTWDDGVAGSLRPTFIALWPA